MKTHWISALLLLTALSCQRAQTPQTDRTRELVRELLTKLDSTDIYEQNKEREIAAIRAQLTDGTEEGQYALCYQLGETYSNFVADSCFYYFEKARDIACKLGQDALATDARIALATWLSNDGFNAESLETLQALSRKEVTEGQLVSYYQAWTGLYHSLYSSYNEPDDFRENYRTLYNVYRDSLLNVADTLSILYLHNIERKEARAGNFAEARRYNDIRLSLLTDHRSGAYATCLYDRFAIAYLYEKQLTAEAMNDLLESTIIEVGNCNRDIASLLRVEGLLININEIEAAKKLSDYYYSSLQKFGSRKRLIDSARQAMRINDLNLQFLQKRQREIQVAFSFISVLIVALVFALLRISKSHSKTARLKDHLERSDKTTKRYVGVVFQLYSSYIKRLDVFRVKIHSSLKKGHIEQALELTSPSKDITAEERKELFQNFDTAFVEIFPDFIPTVNGCLRPEAQIIPKKSEILTTELRILALIKLGIEDSTRIAEMLHCSVKTVYNLRSGLKARLCVTEEEFKDTISRI